MNSQTDQVLHPPPPTSFSQLSFKRSQISSEIHKNASRRRAWLALAALLLLLVMCMGIVFAAHHYYAAFGGQGFLKLRDQLAAYRTEGLDVPKVYLPSRRVVTFGANPSPSGSRRSTSMEVPYYACGDQQASCEAFGQPDICCPIKMTCHPTPFTASNIYCCDSNKTTLGCEGSWIEEPKCLPNFRECLSLEGGGCCQTDTLCSPNGCITITRPTIISSQTMAAGTGPVTVVEVPAATATVVKQGEIARSGVGKKDNARLRLCLPYSCTAILVFIAALMGFL